MKMLYELMLLGGLIAVASAGDRIPPMCCAKCVEAFWNNFHFIPPSDPGVCTQADICFVVDCSGSINQTEFNLLMQFIDNFLASPNIPVSQTEVRVGLVKFNETSNVRFRLDDHGPEGEVRAAVAAIPFGGGFTNIMAGIEDCRLNVFTQSGDRPAVPNIMILLTDGQSNRGGDPTVEAALAKEDNITIVVVGIGNGINVPELEDISSTDSVIEAEDFTDLASLLQDLITDTCAVPAPIKEVKEDGPGVCTIPSNASILCSCNRGPHICEVSAADPTDIDCFTT